MQNEDRMTGRTYEVEYTAQAGAHGPLHILCRQVENGWLLAQPLDVVTGKPKGGNVWISPSHVIVLRFWEPKESPDGD